MGPSALRTRSIDPFARTKAQRLTLGGKEAGGSRELTLGGREMEKENFREKQRASLAKPSTGLRVSQTMKSGSSGSLNFGSFKISSILRAPSSRFDFSNSRKSLVSASRVLRGMAQTEGVPPGGSATRIKTEVGETENRGEVRHSKEEKRLHRAFSPQKRDEIIFGGSGEVLLPGSATSGVERAGFEGAYSIGRLLGNGAYASVFLCASPASRARCAVKIYRKEAVRSKTRREIIANEIRCLRLARHPHLLRLLRVRETRTEIHILTELVEGPSLDQLCKSYLHKRLPIALAKSISKKVAQAFSSLHASDIFHRDIKLENVLIGSDGGPKVIDFGFAIQAPKSSFLSLFCGTPNYMAPELAHKRPYLGAPVDFWAFGVLLFKMLTGDFPFASPRTEELHRKIEAVEFVFPDFVPADARRVIESLLKHDPEDRATFDQILRFSFFAE